MNNVTSQQSAHIDIQYQFIIRRCTPDHGFVALFFIFNDGQSAAIENATERAMHSIKV